MLKHYKDSLQKYQKTSKLRLLIYQQLKKFTQTFLQIQWALLNVITVNVIIRLMLSLLQRRALIVINFIEKFTYCYQFFNFLSVF
jgi:hypothetical protein